VGNPRRMKPDKRQLSLFPPRPALPSRPFALERG
jgi:hypothetical protein